VTTVLYIDETGAFGGAITCMAHLIRHLDRSRYEAVVVLHHKDPVLGERVGGGVPVHVLRRRRIGEGARGRRLRSAVAGRLGRRGARAFALGETFLGLWLDTVPRVAAIRRIAQSHGADLIHTNNSLEINLAGILAARSLRLPCVAHIRNFEPVRRTQRWIFRRVDHCLVQSQAQKEQLVREGLDADRITVVYETVAEREIADIDEGGKTGGRAPTYGITGMLVPWKGHRTFLEAAARIRERYPEARGLIFGAETPMNPGYGRELEEYAATLGLGGAVEFRGLAKDMGAALREIDVFVHASDEPEPFGRVIVEAMAAGKPVVAAGAGGPKEIVVEGKTGFLFEPGDPESLAGGVSRLLGDGELRARMGRAGRERVLKHFAAGRQAAAVEGVYGTTLSARKAETSPR